MNKFTKITSVVLAGTMIAGMLGGCSGKDTFSEQTPTTTAASQQTTIQAQPMETEIVSFVGKDSQGNELSLTPIYNNDGKTIVAGYIISAKDKAGNALTATNYKYLNRVVEAASTGDNVTVTLDPAGNPVLLKTYSDLQGNIVAIEDRADYDKDNNTAEVLKVVPQKTESGNTRLVIDFTTVTIKQEGKKLFMIDGNKKVEVKTVDSSNTAVVQAQSKQAQQTTTKKGQTTTKKGQTTTKQGTTKPKSDTVKIKLKKNSKAECDSNKVEIKTGLVTIKDGGDFQITSSTDNWHGQIVIKLPNTKNADIKIKDVDITYNKGNIIQIIDTSVKSDRTFLETEAASTEDVMDNELKEVSESDKAPNVDISFPDGTSSSFTSSANSYTGVIYNESKLTIKGNGRLKVESNTNADNCICSTKSITIKNCSVNLKTAGDTLSSKLAAGSGAAKGIFSYNKVKVESGSLNVSTNGDGIRATRFICEGGTVSVSSGACDAFDIDNEVTVSGGKVTAVAREKSAFKVRRVNSSKMRAGKNDTFEINGGTVIGEGKKSSVVQSSSSQASIVAMIMNPTTTNPKKKYGNPAKITIKHGDDSVKSSSNEVTSFLYSYSGLSTSKSYTMKASDKTSDVTFSGKVGKASVKA